MITIYSAILINDDQPCKCVLPRWEDGNISLSVSDHCLDRLESPAANLTCQFGEWWMVL